MYHIFYHDWCMFSQNALSLAKSMKIKHTKMNIDKFRSKENLIDLLKREGLMRKNSRHKTAPIIFKDDNFVGGYTEFKKMLEKNK